MRPARAVLSLLVLAATASLAIAESGRTALTVIHAGRLFTGYELLTAMTVVIHGELIAEVLPTADYLPIAGCRTIEARDLTVAPGLIDAHVHILSMPFQYLKDVPRYGWGRIAQESMSLAPENRKRLLQSGITTVIDMGAPVQDMARMESRMEAGKILGPDLVYCGPLFTSPGGHPAGTVYRGRHQLIDWATVQVRGEQEARLRVAQLAGRGVDFIKVVYDDGTLYGSSVPRLEAHLIKMIAEEAHARGLQVFAHVGALEAGFRQMIGCGVDGVEHCFASTATTEVFQEMSRRGVIFTPTLSIYDLFAPEVLPRMKETVRRAYEGGVIIAAGTDFPSTRFMDAGEGFFQELRLLEEAGLPRLEVLKAATVNAAVKAGRKDELGRIEVGGPASLICFDGDIMQGDLCQERVSLVMHHGKIIFEEGEKDPTRRSGFAKKSFLVSPSFFYDAVDGFALGASLLAFNLADTGLALNLFGACSFEASFFGSLSISSPSPIPATSLDLQLLFDNFPKRYFGMSNRSSLEEVSLYGCRNVQVSLNLSSALLKTLKLDTGYTVDYRWIEDSPGLEGGLTTLARLTVAHDTRDSAGEPWYGEREALSAALSHPYLGSARSFLLLGLDLRRYVSIFRHHVLAGRLLYRQSLGEAPFYFLPDFGGNMIGRGFQASRFIGRLGLYGQLEYRFPIWSILGGTLFMDVGQVADSFSELSLEGWHLSGGLGLRVAFSENAILAMDFGLNGEPLAREGWALVFRSSHAF
jgi:imidazolonepropionase-like amidohydrolase